MVGCWTWGLYGGVRYRDKWTWLDLRRSGLCNLSAWGCAAWFRWGLILLVKEAQFPLFCFYPESGCLIESCHPVSLERRGGTSQKS